MAGEGIALDASALLAFLRREPGWEVVDAALAERATISIVNLTEVLTKLAEAGANPRATLAELERERVIGLVSDAQADVLIHVTPMLPEDAIEAARLRVKTKPFGLSLGDRVCLATAHRLGAPVLTADKRWGDVPNLAVAILLIR
ncbi:MAG TPA: type II toxin-antitoxin system VapC family toxin [Chloroflexota bacterium]|nr:type II toxin-antitoxin system VapC family toxin [Chloroflexota bacterium]